jgi:glycosyltransferase involved in cell wall biosynthesis
MEKTKRLIFINQVANYLAEDIVTAMLDHGGYDEVVMIVGNPDNIKLRDTRVKIEPIIRYDRSSVIRRLKSWLIGFMQCQWKLVAKYRSDDLFLVSNPPITPFLTILSRNKFFSLIYDVYPDSLLSEGFVSEGNPIYKLWGKFNKRYFKKAQRIFTIADALGKSISEYVPQEKIEIIPLWYNSIIHRIKREDNEFIREYHLENKFIVMYSGNIGKAQNVDLIPEIANRLRAITNIQFVIIGEGWSKEKVLSRVEELNLDNVLILPYQPLDKISHSLGAADVSYISLQGSNSTVSVPSKTFNCLATGSALLCVAEQNSEIARLVTDNNVGKVFDKSQIDNMCRFIEDLSNNPNLLKQYYQASIKASELYSSNNAIKFT